MIPLVNYNIDYLGYVDCPIPKIIKIETCSGTAHITQQLHPSM